MREGSSSLPAKKTPAVSNRRMNFDTRLHLSPMKSPNSCNRSIQNKRAVAWSFVLTVFVGLVITISLVLGVFSSHLSASVMGSSEGRVSAERKLLADGMMGMLSMNLTEFLMPYTDYVNMAPAAPAIPFKISDYGIPDQAPVSLNLFAGPQLNGSLITPMMSGLIDLMSGGAEGRPSYASITAFIPKAGDILNEWQSILTWVLPFAICLVISLLLCLCAPFVMIVFYCFRCVCNTCGGRKSSKKSFKKKQIYLPVIFTFVAFSFLAAGTIVGYLGDNDFHWSFAVLLDTFGAFLTDILKFLFTIINRILGILQNDVPVAANNLVAEAKGSLDGLKATVKAKVDPYVHPILNQMMDVDGDVHRMKARVLLLNSTVANLTDTVNAIKSSLNLISDDLSDISSKNFSGETFAIEGLPDTSAYVDEIPDLNELVDFNAIMDMFDAIPDLANLTATANMTYMDSLDILDMLRNMTNELDTLKDEQLAKIDGVIGLMKNTQTRVNTIVSNYESVAGVDSAYAPAPDSYKGAALSVDVYRQLAFQAAILLPWIAIILCLIPGLIFRKGFFFTSIGVFISLVIPLMHLEALLYNPLAIIMDDVCVEWQKTDVFGMVGSLVPSSAQPGQTDYVGLGVKVGKGCMDGDNIADHVKVDDFFNVTEMLNIIPGFVSSTLRPMLDMFPIGLAEFNFDEQLDAILAQNFSSLDFDGSFNATSVDFNITQPLIRLREARADLTFSSFNFSSSEIDNALAEINALTFGEFGIIYTLENVTTLNGSDPKWIPTGKQSEIIDHETNMRTALERNASAWELLYSVWGSMDSIDAKMVDIRDALIPRLEGEIDILKDRINVTSNMMPDIDAIVQQLRVQLSNLQGNLTRIMSESKDDITQNIADSTETEAKTITEKGTDLRPIGDCSFLPNVYNGIQFSFCTVMRGGLLGMWFGFIGIGVAAIMFFCLSPFMSKRIKHLFRSSRVDDSSDIDDIELSDMPGGGAYEEEKRMY